MNETPVEQIRPRELVAHAGRGSGPQLMLSALARAFEEVLGEDRAEVSARAGDDGAEAILYLVDRNADPTIAGSCTPTYFTTPWKRGLPVTYRDLTPIAGLVADTYLLVNRSDHPAESAAELFAADTTAAAAPKGGNTHIQAMLIDAAAQGHVSVAFQSTIPDATRAVRDGEVDWTTGVLSDFREDIDSGKLRVLASFGAKGSGRRLPSISDEGVPVEFPLWRGLIGPPRLVAEDIKRWASWLLPAIESMAWRGYLEESGMRSEYLPAAEFARLLDVEAERYLDWSARLAHGMRREQ